MDIFEFANGIAREYFHSSYAYTRLRSKKVEHDEEIVDEETFILHYLLVYNLAIKEISELRELKTEEEKILYLKKRLNE